MKLSPAKPLNADSASERARELHPGAFCKKAVDSMRDERCQVMVEHQGRTYLAASGPTWLDALERFYEWAGRDGEEYGAKLPEETNAVDKQAAREG